MNTKPL